MVYILFSGLLLTFPVWVRHRCRGSRSYL